jgi:hypothetical protein
MYQLDLALLAAQARYGDEAIQVAHATCLGVQVDGMPAAKEPCHDRLGHARGELRCDRRVGSVAAVLEDLDGRCRCRRMSGCHCRLHRDHANGR